jgi:hypothetical protein
MRRCALLLAAATLAACSNEPIPRDDLALRIDTDTYEVELAEGFGLTVTRSWSSELEPEAWDDETLSPLIVRQESVDVRDDGEFVLETRRFRAHAVELGDVRVLPPLLVATPVGGGDEVVVTGEPLDLRVKPVLPAGDATDVELPGGMLAPRRHWGAWLAGAGAVALLALLIVRSRNGGAPEIIAEEPAGPPPEPPGAIAMRALDAAAPLAAADDPRPLHDAVSDALREYARARFGVGTRESTTEELLASVRAAALPEGDVLRDVMLSCAMVRFARQRPDATARERVVADARAFVRSTAEGGA